MIELPTAPACIHFRVRTGQAVCKLGGPCLPYEAGKPLQACDRKNADGSPAFLPMRRRPLPAVRVPQLPCVHLGEPLRREDGMRLTAECPPCSAKVQADGKVLTVSKPIYGCEVHGQCLPSGESPGIQSCAGCVEKLPGIKYGRPIVRHLLYHIAPFRATEAWRSNVEQLRRRMKLFNGRRVVAIVTGPQMHDPDTVKAAFGGDVDQWIVLPNVKDLREVVTFVPLLEAVASTAPHEVIFYAHAKGVTRKPDSIVPRWAEIQYETCLDYWPMIERQLLSHPIIGSFKKSGFAFQDGEYQSKSRWHYSGTFYWLRSCMTFNRDWKNVVDQKWWGNESWPGIVFAPEEGGCLFHGKAPTSFDLYDEKYFKETVEPAYAAWKLEHAADRRML